MVIKHHNLKVVGNYDFYLSPPRPPTTWPTRGPTLCKHFQKKKTDDIQLGTELQSFVSPGGFQPLVPDPSRGLRAPLVGLGMTGV